MQSYELSFEYDSGTYLNLLEKQPHPDFYNEMGQYKQSSSKNKRNSERIFVSLQMNGNCIKMT